MNTENRLLPLSTVLTDEQVNDLARPLVRIIETFYQNPENEQALQKWLKEQEPKRTKVL